MINEAYELSRALEAARILTESWHKDYGTCPKNTTFRLLLAKDASVVDLEPIHDIERIKSLRKWEVSNGTSFPAFNVTPLLRATTDRAKGDVRTFKEILKRQSVIDEHEVTAWIEALGGVCERLWVGSEIERINRCLRSHPESLRQILGGIPPEFKAVEELILRAATLDAHKLEENIQRIVTRQIARAPSDARNWIDSLLVASARRTNKVSLVLEVAESSLFQYPANHQKVQTWINSQLVAYDLSPRLGAVASRPDAFGQPIVEADAEEKFDDAELEVLGKVILRAMSGESPCQARYGRTDSRSFPCNRQIRREMKASLEWLGKPIRKGKTWQNVSDACGYDRGILFVYPSALSADPPELAELFAAEESADQDGAKFEAVAARVTPALDGIVREKPSAEIRVFVLAKPDGYRTKVLVSQTYTAEQMILAAQAWQEGCKNIPPISLNLGTKNQSNWIVPLVPFPTEVVKCLNISWLQAGTRIKPVHGLGIGEGILLLMETTKSQVVVDRALRLAVSNTTPLLLALGHVDRRGDGSFRWNKDTAKYVKHASFLPSLFGLLLCKLGHMKGGYMHTSPFLVGQIFALADTLHREYCVHVRKKETPPQLIGNALMSVALENPTAGLARLSERMAPYQAWANTVTGDGVGLAKWILQRFGQVADELARQPLPERCTDADKAQMLLGYLARPEKEAHHTEEEAANVQGNHE